MSTLKLVVVVIIAAVVISLLFAPPGTIELNGLTLVRLFAKNALNLHFDVKSFSLEGVLLYLASGLAIVIRNGFLTFLTGGLLFGSLPAIRDAVAVSDGRYHRISLRRVGGSMLELYVDGRLQSAVHVPDAIELAPVLGGVPCDPSRNVVATVKNVNADARVVSIDDFVSSSDGVCRLKR